MKIRSSTVAFEGTNTFSDKLGGGIASYSSTLQFIGVNQFTNNTATSGGHCLFIGAWCVCVCIGGSAKEGSSRHSYYSFVHSSLEHSPWLCC